MTRPGGPGPGDAAEGVDKELRSVGFDGHSPAEVFGKATAWLAQRDGAVGVLDVDRAGRRARRRRGAHPTRLMGTERTPTVTIKTDLHRSVVVAADRGQRRCRGGVPGGIVVPAPAPRFEVV